MLSACGGIGEPFVEDAQKLQTEIRAAQDLLTKQQQQMEGLLASPVGKQLSPYARAENWQGRYQQLEKSLSALEQEYRLKIIPILDKNDSKDARRLSDMVARIRYRLRTPVKEMRYPLRRAELIRQTIENTQSLVSQRRQDYRKIVQLHQQASETAAKGGKDFPQKTQKIAKKLQVLTTLLDSSTRARDGMNQQVEKIASGQVDYARLTDQLLLIASNLEKIQLASEQFKKQIEQLYRSYSKILTDMRVDNYLHISLTLWDEYSDYATERSSKTRVKVDRAVRDFFEQQANTNRPFATLVNRRLRLSIPEKYWQALRLQVPRTGYTHGEFWVDKFSYKYYHKYVIVEDKQKKETGWVTVDEKFWWLHQKNLGLTLVEKPYGFFEDEAYTQPSPPFMSYIAEPRLDDGLVYGSNQYGRWQNDTSNGSAFWQFFAAYAILQQLLPGGKPYSYEDWVNYSRRDRDRPYYYGGRYGTYGSHTYNDSRYRNSGYARRNPDLRSPRGREALKRNSSIRGAGPAYRGRGPSAGGK